MSIRPGAEALYPARVAWNLDRVRFPWDASRPTIYDFVRSRLDANGSLGMHPPELPDEVRDPAHVSWSAGSRDGISRHFGVAAADDDTVGAILVAVTRLAGRSTGLRAERLYKLTTQIETLDYLDRVFPYLGGAGIDPMRLSAIGRWLATTAPDRSTVKFGIALMGIAQPADIEVLSTLGSHDEFSLYVAVALLHTDAGERALFELAKRVHGWGRVQAIDRLAGTTDPEIQHWMITEGHRNSVMDEYTAITCATTGRLVDALAMAEIDDLLVTSAGELIIAILTGDPGQSADEYTDLVPVLQSYLAHLTLRIGSLPDRRIVAAVGRFLDDPGDVDIESGDLAAMRSITKQFLNREHFRGEAERGLVDPDSSIYWAAKNAAKDFGIDVYEAVYDRIEARLDERPPWFDLLRATDEARLERTLELGRRRIDLDSIATGPSEAIGLGPGFEAHSQLGWFLQDLGRFPGHGWDLVSTGLASPSIQNRNRSIRTLQEWPRNGWPGDAEARLRSMIDAEIDPEVRRFATDVLQGDVPIEESWRRAIDDLNNRPEVALLARELADTEPARRLRAKGTWTSLVIWDGAYDTEAWDHAHCSIEYAANGYTIRFSEGRDTPTESTAGLTTAEALAQAGRLLRRMS